MAKRNIVRIDEAKCTGCGLCVTPCAEGAIEIRDGKARVISDSLCDGAGVCLNVCPEGALSIEQREADPFDAVAAEKHLQERAAKTSASTCNFCGTSEEKHFLILTRHAGESGWVCTRCLPRLIHG